jgi:hypothetical protein
LPGPIAFSSFILFGIHILAPAFSASQPGSMHHTVHFSTSGRRAPPFSPAESMWHNSQYNAFMVDLPCSAAGRARSCAAYRPDGMGRSATTPNNALSGQLVGSWMRAMCSITRADLDQTSRSNH